MLQSAPPETLEAAHTEAFTKLSPEQRRLALGQLAFYDTNPDMAGANDNSSGGNDYAQNDTEPASQDAYGDTGADTFADLEGDFGGNV